MPWKVERDPDGTPRRLRWVTPEQDAQYRRLVEESRPKKFVEPHPWPMLGAKEEA